MGLLGKMFGKRNRPTLREDIVTAKNWIAVALTTSGYKADFTIESLKEIDRFFDEQNVPGGLLSEQVGQRLFAIGAYIGEVIIAVIGGEWETDDSDPGGEINIAVKLPDGNVVWPVHRAMGRYKNGKEDSIYAYVSLLTK